jgi:hypothetical protein
MSGAYVIHGDPPPARRRRATIDLGNEDPYVQVDRSLVVRAANPAFVRRLVRSPTSLDGIPLRSVICPADVDRLVAGLQEARSGQPVHVPVQVVRRDRTLFAGSCEVVPLSSGCFELYFRLPTPASA